MTSSYEQHHEKFLGWLDESQAYVELVAGWLRGRGYPVKVMPHTRAEHRADWQDHSDHGDLEVTMRVEVKRLSATFSSAEDWPFGPHYIVCSRHSWDAAKPKPYCYIHLSADDEHLAVVLGSSHRHWSVASRTDHRTGLAQECYFAPLSHVHFSTLSDF